MFSTQFYVCRNIQVQSNVENVYATVADFRKWPQWSPWICKEPSCKYETFNEPRQKGHRQKWDGELIGVGEMVLVEEIPNKYLKYDLHFLKPWKSHSQVQFKFEDQNDKTLVTWTMLGSIPVFLFLMKKMMSALVGGDFERGLLMLKELIEKGNVPSKTLIKGLVQRDDFYYIGYRHQSSKDKLGSIMEKDYSNLFTLVEKHQLPQPEFILAIYHNFDLISSRCDFSTCFGYKNKPSLNIKEDGIISGYCSDHEALQINHTGPYKFLGNAWSTAMSYLRFKKAKSLKEVPMYEIYANDPREVPETEIQTEIFLPIR